MANKVIKGLTIQIGADTVGLNNALKSMESATKKAQSELREVEKTIKTSGDSAVLWKQKQDLINTALDESKKKLKLLEDAQEQVNKQVKEGKISEEQYRAFQREVEYARAEVGKYENQLTQANSKLREFGTETDRAADETAELSKETAEASEQTARASEGFTVMKGVLANLVTDGIRFAARELKELTTDVIHTGAAFEAAMGQVAAISQASASEVEQLSNKAKEMGATTKFTAEQSAEAFNYMAMAGWKTEDMLNGIDGILGLAAASGEDLGTTSDIVTDALTAFGLKAADAGHFADVMAAASSNANTNVSMMGETFKYTAPIAGALGYSVEDTALAIGLMANSGIKASQAGTALRTIMSNLTTDFVVCGKEIGEITVETQNADGSMRDFADIIADTSAAFDKLSESEKASQAEALVGKNAMSGFLALVNAAPEDVDKLSGAIENCSGAAQGMADTMMDNLAGDITVFQSAVDGAKIELSDELQPALRDVVRYATEQVPKIGKALKPVFKEGAEFVSFLLKELPSIIKRGKDMIPVITGIGATVASLHALDKVSKFTSALQKGDTVMKALNITMSANPAVAVAAAVVGLTAALIALNVAMSENEDIAKEVSKAYEADFDAVSDVRDELSKLKDDFNSRAGDVAAEFSRTESLWKELDKLADASGRVKDSDQKRAEYILGELNDALGTEYTMTGNQINSYKQLSQEIDNIIAKKKAEAYLDDYLAMSSGMAKNKSESMAQYEKSYADYSQAKEDKNAAEAEYERLTGFSSDQVSPNDFIEIFNGYTKSNEQIEAAKNLQRALERINNATSIMNEAKRNYLSTTEYFGKLEEAEKAYAEERYKDIEKILYSEKDANLKALNDTKSSYEERKKAYKALSDKIVADAKLSAATVDKNTRKTFSETIENITKQAEEGGLQAGELLATGIVDKLSMIDGFDISALLDFCSSAGITLGDALASASADRVRELLNPVAASIDYFSNSRSSASQLLASGLDKAFGNILDQYFYADGGTLREGQGIIAEAGPELIRINNGTAHITPLSRGARNIPIENGSGNIVVNNINVYAEIANDYDVYRLGEKIAAAQKNVDVGKGLA
ncbi:phage tail tape measure protein [Ruminococcus sp.]|uniref:phage tail tape measure protein n=1 Tax=Ruminococcus sp. TaxID=41978 RepID=UPI001B617613|nr:phage tail tape measure protein [Ruminococcus sp.]MBP5431608.1 phage tail tape measure protein [Ruminococcus sp.]